MTSDDLLGDAIEELYSADPEEFTQRRSDLVARARSAGQAPVARQIAALRKPTRSAWVINQLARADPDAASQLAELGEELRAAERSRDGSSLRELSQARRRLIAALVRQALAVSGQHEAPAAMREDITATLAAALADPEVAEQIRHGTLLRPARRAGFGTEQGPVLALVPPPAQIREGGAGTDRTGRAGPSAGRPAADAGGAKAGRAAAATGRAAAGRDHRAGEHEPEQPRTRAEAEREHRAGEHEPEQERTRAEAERERRAAAEADEARSETERERRASAEADQAQAETERERRAAAEAERVRAEAERERRQARADAEQALAGADAAVQTARTAEQELTDTIRRLEQQLADLRRRLHEARAQARHAQIAQRKARQVLGRLPE